MSPALCSQGVVLATAMAVSGTVILLAFRRQRAYSPPLQLLRSCISADGKTKEKEKEKEKKKKKKKKKRVHFAEDVVDPCGDSEEFRRQHGRNSSLPVNKSGGGGGGGSGGDVKGMPANRLALYNGILRERGVHRLAYSY